MSKFKLTLASILACTLVGFCSNKPESHYVQRTLTQIKYSNFGSNRGQDKIYLPLSFLNRKNAPFIFKSEFTLNLFLHLQDPSMAGYDLKKLKETYLHNNQLFLEIDPSTQDFTGLYGNKLSSIYQCGPFLDLTGNYSTKKPR